MDSVFISYARDDASFAGRLAKDLRLHDFEAQTFEDVVPSGALANLEKLHGRIEGAIAAGTYFIPVLTPSSVQSRWVREEIFLALKLEAEKTQVKILPAMAQSCLIPDELQLRSPADFTRSYAEGLDDLVARLSAPQGTSVIPRYPSADSSAEASRLVEGRLLSYLTAHSEKLYELSPRRFEKLVAEVLRQLGYQVELTAASRDGGVDIVALGGRDAERVPIMIQCKRYSPGKRVGVEVVRSLYGVMSDRAIQRGMIVTTSNFTRSAAMVADEASRVSRDRWKLDLVDMSKLLSWLARASTLGNELTQPLAQLRQRHGELIDKKFLTALSVEEEGELRRIETTLDRAEADFYQPLTEALRRERDNLVARLKDREKDREEEN